MYSRDPPSQILYCYGIYQPLFDDMERDIPNFTSRQGLPSVEELDEFTMDRRHKLIVIDDLMHRVVQNKEMELLFTQGTHHRCVSVILITQNLYPGGKHARTIALNTWYMVLIEGRFTGRYTRTSAIPRPKKRIYEHLRGRAELSTRLFDRGYQTTRGRSISSEDQGISRTTPYRLSTDVRRTREDVRITMVELIKEQRHFLKLFVQMTSAQRKALLQTITQRQIRALSQIAHNIIKFRIKLSPTELS